MAPSRPPESFHRKNINKYNGRLIELARNNHSFAIQNHIEPLTTRTSSSLDDLGVFENGQS